MASWVLLLAQVPGAPPTPAGVLLLDPATDELHVALRDAVSNDQDIREVWDSLRQELAERSSEIGGARLLDSLEEDLSLFLQVQAPRQQVATTDPEQTLKALFKGHVLNRSAFSRGI
jgi:hypothetical protein